jgi:hypothetical protein
MNKETYAIIVDLLSRLEQDYKNPANGFQYREDLLEAIASLKVVRGYY